MLVFIHACEDFYEGLHGVEDMRVADVLNMDEADEWGREMSYEVIESFGMEEHYGFDEDDFEDGYGEHLVWTVHKIKDEYVHMGAAELERLATCVHGADDFIELFCELG